MIYDTQGNKPTKNVAVELNDRNKFSITDDQALLLAKWACIIEDHYSNQAGRFKPMDMEWALDGKTNELFIVQARPETVQSQKNLNSYTTYTLSTTKKPVVIGKSVGQQIATGKVKVIKNVKDINQFKKGEILVTEMTDPDWEPIMKIASGIITNKGGRTCHASIVSRELGIPCIVGTLDGTAKLETGDEVTMDCSSGDTGFVYKGKIPFTKETVNLKEIQKTKTQLTMNVGNPEQAFDLSFIPNEGVGLAREEFIINSGYRFTLLLL